MELWREIGMQTMVGLHTMHSLVMLSTKAKEYHTVGLMPITRMGKQKKEYAVFQDHARVLIMQACHKWPEAISLHLWPYTI